MLHLILLKFRWLLDNDDSLERKGKQIRLSNFKERAYRPSFFTTRSKCWNFWDKKVLLFSFKFAFVYFCKTINNQWKNIINIFCGLYHQEIVYCRSKTKTHLTIWSVRCSIKNVRQQLDEIRKIGEGWKIENFLKRSIWKHFRHKSVPWIESHKICETSLIEGKAMSLQITSKLGGVKKFWKKLRTPILFRSCLEWERIWSFKLASR